ncbi:MAG: hypothetical protein ACYCVH_08960 [Ignavibacteriaceae bacterium]
MNNWNGIASLLIACMGFILIINLLIFAEKNSVNKKVLILITLLMVYQTLEFLMCGLNLRYSTMAYFAFVDISFLPPLNLYFVLEYYGEKKSYTKFIFLPAIMFAVYYSAVIPKFVVVSCTALYASYSYPLGTLFGVVYYLPLIISMIILSKGLRRFKKKDVKKVFLLKIILGGLIFISIPVVIAFIFLAFNRRVLLNSIESIMCKFAFVYVVCLSIFILNNKKVSDERNNF